MPTTVTKIVDPDNGGGTDYTSLSAWEAGEQGDLTAADEIRVAECRSTSGTADTTSVLLSGWTTDATRYIVIQSSGANRHNGEWDASKYRLTTSGAHGIFVSTAHTRVIGLQIETAVSASAFVGCFLGAASGRVSSCIIKAIVSSTGTCYGVGASGANVNYVYNNLVIVSGDGSGFLIGIINQTGATSTLYAENNTVVKLSGPTDTYGLFIANGGTIARNNLVYAFGDTNTYSGTFATGTDNNTTDSSDSIGTGSNNSTSQTFSFTDSGGGDYSLTSGDTGARNKGTTLAGISSGFTDDIIGQARDASGAIDCGCFEFPVTFVPYPFSRGLSGGMASMSGGMQ